MNVTTTSTIVSSPVEGSTATQQEPKQTFALKVQFNDDIRRFNLAELSFESLLKRVSEVFNIPEAKLLLKFTDEEGDLITITSTDDLFDAQRLAAQSSTMLRLIASCNRKKNAETVAATARNESAAPASPSVTDYKEHKKALKEQKKLLKEEKKRLLKSSPSSSPVDYKQQKKLLKEEKKELKTGKEELKAIKKEAKFLKKAEAASIREARRDKWRNMSVEERIALRKARHEARGQVPHEGDGKSWKDMTREERFALRLARREAKLAQGGHHHGGGCRNKIIGRFVKHVTIPDGSVFEPGQSFVKTWRMRNEGEEPWNDCKLIFVSRKNGDLMGAPEEVPVLPSPVAPGSEVDVSVNMIAPNQPGRYVGFWRLSAADGRKFGQRIWVKIDVVVSSSSSSDEKEAPAPSASSSESSGFKNLEDEIEDSSFIDIKEKEDTPAAGKPTVADLLKQLKALGFADVGKNIPLLNKHDGDINKVIADLLA